jgi:hypothetical protein
LRFGAQQAGRPKSVELICRRAELWFASTTDSQGIGQMKPSGEELEQSQQWNRKDPQNQWSG